MYFDPVQAVRFLQGIRSRVQEVLSQNAPLKTAQLAVDGHDLMAELGVTPGPIVGRIIQGLLDMVIDDPRLNNRADLLEAARRLLEQDQGS